MDEDLSRTNKKDTDGGQVNQLIGFKHHLLLHTLKAAAHYQASAELGEECSKTVLVPL